MSDDELLRAYAHLDALRRNVPVATIRREFAARYDDEVRRIGRELGSDLDEFLTPADAYYRPLAPRRGAPATEEAEESHVRRELFLERFDALLSYLQYRMPPQVKQRIGFPEGQGG